MADYQQNSRKVLWVYSIIILVIGLAIGFFLGRSNGRKACGYVGTATQSSYSASCRTCKELRTCDEARVLLRQGCLELDRDGDGVPCENLCGKRK